MTKLSNCSLIDLAGANTSKFSQHKALSGVVISDPCSYLSFKDDSFASSTIDCFIVSRNQILSSMMGAGIRQLGQSLYP